MRTKYGRLRKTENIIVFPGTFERLVENGLVAVEQENFPQAVKAFDEAIQYEPDYPEFLGPYAVALYETRDFQRAKEIAARLLHSGKTDYIDAMELYLTISIQLQEYEEVEMTIGTLLDEGIIPQDMLTKFNYIRELNERLSNRYGTEEYYTQQQTFTLEEFRKMSARSQQVTLASLEGTDLSEMTLLLQEIAEMEDMTPLVITFALTLLHQVELKDEVTVRKFGLETKCIPANMTLPGQDELTKYVKVLLNRLLSKDPSRLEMAHSLVEKFAITAFPFNWGESNAEEVATAYVHYIECLFSGKELPNTKLNILIQQTDMDLDF
ncbi:tetratricopeptide repeat protein [Sporosarcina limicola]|uniref:Tetratricopeptide (TPR) repeat protein n=1 Tax=Sporosarcina limicola TaxID=34101 RepID=A0A927RCN3_9BACL|nr:tetratricopeptide repeat protein [Sporosarcina limicola]MBE1554550.1 tetratricopeptide (TPR) repeat protein [Sporosarcina limicola]